jgi:hypothetical protein
MIASLYTQVMLKLEVGELHGESLDLLWVYKDLYAMRV